MPVLHFVLVQFKEGTSEEFIRDTHHEIISLQTNCLTAQTQKTYIKSIRGGKNMSIEGLEDGINHAYVMEFESEADRNYYVEKDPVHLDIKAKLVKMIETGDVVKAQVVDVEPGKI